MEYLAADRNPETKRIEQKKRNQDDYIAKKLKEIEKWVKLMQEIGYSMNELESSGPILKQIHEIQLRKHNLVGKINYDDTYVLDPNGYKNLLVLNEVFKVNLDVPMVFAFNIDSEITIGSKILKLEEDTIIFGSDSVPRLTYSVSKFKWCFIKLEDGQTYMYDSVNSKWSQIDECSVDELRTAMFQCTMGEHLESLIYDITSEYLNAVTSKFLDLYSDVGLAASGETAMYMVSNLQRNAPLSQPATVPELNFNAVGVYSNIKLLNWRKELPKAMWIEPYISFTAKRISDDSVNVNYEAETNVIVGGDVPYVPDFISTNEQNEFVLKSDVGSDSTVNVEMVINDAKVTAQFKLYFLAEDVIKIESPKAYFAHNSGTFFEKPLPSDITFDDGRIIYDFSNNFVVKLSGFFILETDIDAMGAGTTLNLSINNVSYSLAPVVLDGKLAWKGDVITYSFEVKPNAKYIQTSYSGFLSKKQDRGVFTNLYKREKISTELSTIAGEEALIVPSHALKSYFSIDKAFNSHDGLLGRWFIYKDTSVLLGYLGGNEAVRYSNASAKIGTKLPKTGGFDNKLMQSQVGTNVMNDFTDEDGSFTRKLKHMYNGYLCDGDVSLVVPHNESVRLSLTETVIPSFNTNILRPPENIITPISLSHELIFATNDIKRLQALINKMWDVIVNLDKRIDYLDRWCDNLEKQINAVIAALQPNKSLHVGQIVSMLSGAIGMFMPLVGIAGETLGALIDGIEQMAKGDYVDGAVDFMIGVVMGAYGIHKFLQRRLTRYKQRSDDPPSYDSLFGRFHGTTVIEPKPQDHHHSLKKSKGSVLTIDLPRKKISKFEFDPESKGWRFTIGPENQKQWNLTFNNGKPVINNVEVTRSEWIRDFMFELNSVVATKRRTITTQPVMTTMTLLCEAPSGDVKRGYGLDTNSEYWLNLFKNNPDFCESLLQLDDVAGL